MHFFSLNVNIEFISLFLPYYACFLCKFFSLTLHICRVFSHCQILSLSIYLFKEREATFGKIK